MGMSAANLIGGFVFGTIGFVAFYYGKKMHVWTPMLIGLGLMGFPYFIGDTVALYLVGTVGTAALFFCRS